MLGVVGIHVEVFPRVEAAGECDVVVGGRCVGDVYAHLYALQAGHFRDEAFQSFLDDGGILRLGLALRLVKQTEEYDVCDHGVVELLS